MSRSAGDRRRSRLGLWATLAALAAAALAPASASAGSDVAIVVQNDTPYTLKLGAGGDSQCWYDEDLAPAGGPAIPPGTSKQLMTQLKASGSCFFDRSWRGLGVLFKQSDGAYQDAITTGQPNPPTGGRDQWQLMSDDVIAGNFSSWLPINPIQDGKGVDDGGGMFCVTPERMVNQDSTTGWGLKLRVRQAGDCHPDADFVFNCVEVPDECLGGKSGRALRQPRYTPASPAPAGARQAASAPGKDPGAIVFDLFDLGRAACDLLEIKPAWGPGCDEIAKPAAWDLGNVSTDIRDVKVTNDPTPTYAKELRATEKFENLTDLPGTQEYSSTVTAGETTTTTTSLGITLGEKASWSAETSGIVFGGKLGFEISSTQNYGTTTAQMLNRSVSETIKFSIPTKPRAYTYLLVYQGTGDVGVNFTADLTLGTPGSAEALKTPVARSLGMSAARNHPCAGYLVGDGDANSLIGLAKTAHKMGYSDKRLDLPQDQRNFLRAAQGFSVSDAAKDRCPGWPQGYPAAASFKGQASVVGHMGAGQGCEQALGSGASNCPKWIEQAALADHEVCAYSTDLSPQPQPQLPAPGPNLNCTAKGEPTAGSHVSPGTVVDGADDPTTNQLDGNHESNLILADDDPDADLLRGYDGPFDTLVGSRHPEALEGGAGDDYLTAKEGPDRLDGGPGDDALYGGSGDDRVVDVAGHTRVDGGAGDDQLSSAATASGGLFGGPGDDRLALRGRGRVMLAGGTGDDGYRLDDDSSRRVFELPAQGVDTIHAGSSMRLPANVERVVARGRDGVELTAGLGDQDLIGASGPDTLAGGPGADVLRGRRGRDTLLLSRYGFDHARGGPGADRFVARVDAARTPTSRWGLPKARPSAHLIEDFDRREGDRIVLVAGRRGSALSRLRGNVRIRRAAYPRGNRPQLLFTRRDSLLRFDPDGRRRRPPVVIAIVKGHKRLRAGAIRIVTR